MVALIVAAALVVAGAGIIGWRKLRRGPDVEQTED
jgi:hypothetical protein